MDERQKERFRANLPPFLLIVVMIVIMFATLMVTSCSPRVIERVVEVRDSVYVDRIEYRDTTVYVTLPAEVMEVRANADSSYLETSVAASIAQVDSSGNLTHRLWNFPRPMAVRLQLPTREIRTGATTSTEHLRQVVKEVEMPLTKWQTLRMRMGEAFMAILLFGLVFFGIKFYLRWKK